MAWEDRSYYRDRSSGQSGGPLSWIWFGSLPLFKVFHTRVRVHATFLLFVALTLLIGGRAYPLRYRITTMAALAGAVLLHELGHCFVARRNGGSADEVVLTPLGGLAVAEPRRRPMPTLLAILAGPAVNVGICLASGAALKFLTPLHWLPSLNPFTPLPPVALGWSNPALYLWAIFIASYFLIVFNLLPIYPLDGGQLVQTVLQPLMGHQRSVLLCCFIGMMGAGALAVIGLSTKAWWLLVLAVSLFLTCLQRRQMIREEAADEFEISPGGVDFSASLRQAEEEKPARRRRGANRRALKRARKIARAERAERERVDVILAKVSTGGMKSLTFFERRTLKKTSERRRRSEMELQKYL